MGCDKSALHIGLNLSTLASLLMNSQILWHNFHYKISFILTIVEWQNLNCSGFTQKDSLHDDIKFGGSTLPQTPIQCAKEGLRYWWQVWPGLRCYCCTRCCWQLRLGAWWDCYNIYSVILCEQQRVSISYLFLIVELYLTFNHSF